MSQEPVEIIALGGASLAALMGKDKGFEKSRFLECTEWLKHSITVPDGTFMPIIEAFRLGFSHSLDQIENKIEAARLAQLQRGGRDPEVTVANATERLGDSILDVADEKTLLEWYTQLCPRTHRQWFEFARAFKDFLVSQHRTRVTDRVRFLRNYLFKTAAVEGGVQFWESLIQQAYTGADQVRPAEAGKYIERIALKKKLALIGEHPTDLMAPEYQLLFEDYLKLLGTEFKERILAHGQLLEWVIGYGRWRAEKTRTQIVRYRSRSLRDNPWGEQSHWENVLRIRRTLESMKLKPPKSVSPFEDEEITEERTASTLDKDPEHPLHGNPEMIRWYIKVNQRALEMTKRKLKTGSPCFISLF